MYTRVSLAGVGVGSIHIRSKLPCQLPSIHFTSTVVHPLFVSASVFRQFVSTISCARVWKFCLFGDWGRGRHRARCEEQTRTKGGKIEERVGKIEKNFRSIGSILFLSNLDVYCIRLMILLYTGDIARSPSYWPNSTCRSFSHLLSIRFYLFLFFSILLPLPR